MGIDITAYSKVKKLDCNYDDDGEPVSKATGEPVDFGFLANVNTDFPGRNGSLEAGAAYDFEKRVVGMDCGYGAYNGWRNQLAALAGWPAVEYKRYSTVELRHDAAAWAASEGPFWELITFTDCDGIIGAEVAAKLHKDFKQFAEKAAQHDDEWFRENYASMSAAFELAADEGAVRFH
ncbi:hypothetical protein WH367_16570 [Comamonas sp. MYb21]